MVETTIFDTSNPVNINFVCSKCNKSVEGISLGPDYYPATTHFTVYCHGQKQVLELGYEYLRALRDRSPLSDIIVFFNKKESDGTETTD